MDLSILFIPFQEVVFLCEGRALEVAKAVLPLHSLLATQKAVSLARKARGYSGRQRKFPERASGTMSRANNMTYCRSACPIRLHRLRKQQCKLAVHSYNTLTT